MLRCSIFCLTLVLAPGQSLWAQENTAAKSQSEGRSGSARPEAAAGDYVLQPQDLVRVQVFQEPDLERELRVSQEASVALPLIGNVEVRNKTVRQAEEIIRRLYDADYLVNPQVNLTVLEYAPRSVDVVGAVNTPGVVYFPKEEGLTLIGAISRAGSFNRLANKKQVTLKRTLPDGRIETFRIDVDDLMKGETTDKWPLQPGDVITVPERIL
jgi:polysaccharide biosynthesis/export protein